MTDEGTASADVEHLLARGGFAVPDRTDRGVETSALPRYNALADPAGGERLGGALAQSVDAADIGTVLIWEEALDVALAFVVARDLGVPAVRCFDNDGLAAFEGTFGAGDGAVIVADVLRDAEPVRAMLALADQQAKSVIAALVLVDLDTPGAEVVKSRGVPVRSLASST